MFELQKTHEELIEKILSEEEEITSIH